MIAENPFTALVGMIPPEAMQAYVVVMFLLVVGGTLLDVIHKKSAQYFFENAEKAKANAKRSVSSGEKTSLAVQTLTSEVLTSSEFSNPQRRISHLFTMYGFIIFVVMTAVMIFAYPTAETPAPEIVPTLWHVGAAMLCFGGYWFWFFIRADVSAEGHNWYELSRADIFIVSLLATCTFALIWSFLQSSGVSASSMVAFGLFILSATVLFSTVLWSKFAHMFFKPAAAFQKKVTKADGSMENLPEIPDLASSETKQRFPDIPEYMGDNPSYMGLGINREQPRHY